MRTKVKRMGWVMLVAVAALATTAPGVGAYLAMCANYITSSGYDEPIVGWLIGERSITQTTTTQYGSTGGWKVFTSSVSRTSVTTISDETGSHPRTNDRRSSVSGSCSINLTTAEASR